MSRIFCPENNENEQLFFWMKNGNTITVAHFLNDQNQLFPFKQKKCSFLWMINNFTDDLLNTCSLELICPEEKWANKFVMRENKMPIFENKQKLIVLKKVKISAQAN